MENSGYSRRRGVVFFLLSAALLVMPAALHAQLTRGTISGTVVDATNAVIPDSTVTIRNLATGIERQTTTNDVGVYRFPAVEPGAYSIEFKRTGFQNQKVETVTVGAAQEIVVHQTM